MARHCRREQHALRHALRTAGAVVPREYVCVCDTWRQKHVLKNEVCRCHRNALKSIFALGLETRESRGQAHMSPTRLGWCQNDRAQRSIPPKKYLGTDGHFVRRYVLNPIRQNIAYVGCTFCGRGPWLEPRYALDTAGSSGHIELHQASLFRTSERRGGMLCAVSATTNKS